MREAERRSGLTLVEIAVFVCILVVVAAFLLPGLAKVRTGVPRASCMNNLKQIGLACMMYADDWGGMMPATADDEDIAGALELLYPNYCNTMRVFVCPKSLKEPATGGTLTKDNISYGYVPGLSIEDDPDTAYVLDEDDDALNGQGPRYTKRDNHGKSGANVLYLDGHVKWMKGKTVPGIGNVQWPRDERTR